MPGWCCFLRVTHGEERTSRELTQTRIGCASIPTLHVQDPGVCVVSEACQYVPFLRCVASPFHSFVTANTFENSEAHECTSRSPRAACLKTRLEITSFDSELRFTIVYFQATERHASLSALLMGLSFLDEHRRVSFAAKTHCLDHLTPRPPHPGFASHTSAHLSLRSFNNPHAAIIELWEAAEAFAVHRALDGVGIAAGNVAQHAARRCRDLCRVGAVVHR